MGPVSYTHLDVYKRQDNSGAKSTPADGDDPYANIDLSKEETVVMYASASEPNAINEVMEAANEKIKAAINTTIDLYFIPSAERAQKYPLVMAGGDTDVYKRQARWSRIRCFRKGTRRWCWSTKKMKKILSVSMIDHYRLGGSGPGQENSGLFSLFW